MVSIPKSTQWYSLRTLARDVSDLASASADYSSSVSISSCTRAVRFYTLHKLGIYVIQNAAKTKDSWA
jgi:hypothetical protein